MTENDYRLINLRYSCPLLRREDILAGKVPTAPTISSIIAGMQVQEALKLIHGLLVESGTACVFNGMTNQFYKTAFQRRDDCLSHETYPAAVELPLAAATNTANELFAALAAKCEIDGAMRLELDRDLVVSVFCAQCQIDQRIMKPQQLVGMQDAICPKCGQTAKPVLVHSIGSESELAIETLSTLGVPPYDIVRVETSVGEKLVLLANDK
jgi:adenylyltransferase/sulfurtransferase